MLQKKAIMAIPDLRGDFAATVSHSATTIQMNAALHQIIRTFMGWIPVVAEAEARILMAVEIKEEDEEVEEGDVTYIWELTSLINDTLYLPKSIRE